jgi:hypothetical protein
MHKIRISIVKTIKTLISNEAGLSMASLLIGLGVAGGVGAAVPVSTKILNSSKEQSHSVEMHRVETAVEMMMAYEGLADLRGCPLLASNENEMTKFPCPKFSIAPGYMRLDETKACYTIALDGTVTLGTCAH